ncbi:short-chain dehydrogenase/reductase SDR [Salinisphaera dokdonensis CL-ES53]|uniref:Enoyl-[acyl-carrier-protein] reductase [NADH] n=1 Tax=Salinisphaera dokdonensis CL-ES53 TaxID=1304272 RepID=A0ABV2B432_9GAMM
MGFLEGKKALITGLASERSIAYGIAQSMRDQGAEIALTYQGEKLKPRVEKMAESLGASIILPLDVAKDEEIEGLFTSLAEHWSELDVLVHAIGFAPRESLNGSYLDTLTREAASISHDISAYSFGALAKAGRHMLSDRASLVTLTYLGASKVMPGYNIMGPVKASLESSMRFMAAELGPQGIRVNAISAGPIKTLAAAGIRGFRDMLSHARNGAPLRRNVTQEEVGNAAAFLGSDLASGITGEVLYVDAGYQIMGATAGAGDA